MTTPRSAWDPLTCVVAVAELLSNIGSLVSDATVAVLLIVEPPAAAGSTRTTRVNVAVSPLATVELDAVTVPVPPTAGVVVRQPAGASNETKPTPGGNASFSVTVDASPGPLFPTTIE